VVAGLIGRADENDARLLRVLFEPPLAAAAGMNLGLHDRQLAAEFGKSLRSLVGGLRDNALRHGNAGRGEELFGLVFVNLHEASRTVGLVWKKPRYFKEVERWHWHDSGGCGLIPPTRKGFLRNCRRQLVDVQAHQVVHPTKIARLAGLVVLLAATH